MAKPGEVKGLREEDTLRQAAGKILWVRFNDMWAFHSDVAKKFDADAVHDMRVASRRLRVVMQTVRGCFPRRSFSQHYRTVQEIADLLGQVRDRDVLIEELCRDRDSLPEDQRGGVAGYIVELTVERDRHRNSLQELLRRLDEQAYDRTFLSYIARAA